MKGRPLQVAIASCRDTHAADPEHEAVIEALAAEGVAATVHAWDDSGFDPSGFSAVVIRSTWDYFHHRDAFLLWASAVEAVTPLWNSAEVVRWNSDKRYLKVLAQRQIPVVATEWISPGGPTVDLLALLERRGWSDVVIKPAVSAGAFLTARFEPRALARARDHLEAVLQRGEAMVQPYLRSVEEHGERSLIWIDGAVTHAVRRQPALSARGGPLDGADPVVPAPDELALAEDLLAPLASQLLYARVDMVRTPVGSLQLMELELVEPSLFLRHGPGAAARLARGIARRLEDMASKSLR